MISQEKLKILTLLQKLPKNWFGQTYCCCRLWKVSQSSINHPIWSHWLYVHYNGWSFVEWLPGAKGNPKMRGIIEPWKLRRSSASEENVWKDCGANSIEIERCILQTIASVIDADYVPYIVIQFWLQIQGWKKSRNGNFTEMCIFQTACLECLAKYIWYEIHLWTRKCTFSCVS